MDLEPQPQDTLRDPDERKSSKVILDQLSHAEDVMREWNDWCDTIDDRFSLHGTLSNVITDDWTDQRYDLLWSSMEVVKPAVYTKAPQPVASPRFSNKTRLLSTTSEMLERCICTSFDQGDINDVMLEIRDDLVMTNRGVIWVRQDGQKVCYEQIDRKDFRHGPARKWQDVPWVARRGWMTETEVEDRFDLTRDELDSVFFQIRKDQGNRDATDLSHVAGVWEVWHKADDRVYWVVEGCDFILEDAAPHQKLERFFPCPKPAYGTLRRRTLVPIPDYFRYAPMLHQVNDLTRRIYDLLAWVKMIGLVPGGGDVSEAITAAFREHSDDTIIIPVPAASFSNGGNFVQWIPIAELAQAIQGLLEARDKIIQDFYQLSGISDIMRGATEAQETLGAQQLKSQYGSVRVRDKINELQRVARDAARIGAEIISENFTQDTIMDMAMMDLPTKREVDKAIRDAEKAADTDMKALTKELKEAAEAGADPQELQGQLQQKQQEIFEKYAPILRDSANAVTIDAVMELLRKDKSRGFQIDIATDSTVLTDEMTEKQQRAELMAVVNQSIASAPAAAQMGKEVLALWGGMFKFSVGPYKAGREIDALVDDVVDNAEQIAAAMAPEEGEGQELAAANMKLAEAEMAKAQAQTAKVTADAQGKMQDLQLRFVEAQEKAKNDQQAFAAEMEKLRAEVELKAAQTTKTYAEIEAMGGKAAIDAGRLELDAAKAAADVTSKRMEQEQRAQDSARNAAMGERQQAFNEQSGDRQMTLAERQAQTAQETENGGR